MENTRIVSFIGYERSDFPYFLSLMLKDKKYRTLIIDNSCNHDLFLSMKRPDEDTDHVEYDQNVYMRNKSINIEDPKAFEKFDVVIIYHGMNIDYELLTISNIAVLTTNYEPATIRNINDFIDMEIINAIPKENLFLILRDKVSTKIAEQLIHRQLGLTKIEQEYILYYDEGNYNAYINFCFNGAQNLKGITSDMKAAISAIKVALVGDDKKRKKKKTKQEEEE